MLLKTYHQLAKKLVSFENIHAAAGEAARGKRDKANVQRFMYHLEENLMLLKEELAAGTYKPRGYVSFYIRDPKRRQISAAAFRDRVVHHALCNVIEPIFEKTFIFDTYANRTGKGSHAAIRRAQAFMRQNRFVLKCDIKKYFATIDHEILKQHIRWRIADAHVLRLVDLIIDNSNQQEFVYDIFPGDDLFTPLERRKGLPLGNLTSQFFANLYLNQFDHFIKEKLSAKYYIRYVDDFLIASNSKDFLHNALRQCEQHLAGLRLKLHPRKCHILQSNHGVPFLGQIIYADYRLLKKENVRRFTKRLKKRYAKLEDGRITRKEFDASISGWRGHAAQADTWRLRKELDKKFSSFGIKLADHSNLDNKNIPE